MEDVVIRGTATNIYDENFSMAGKTGTCQTDYWKGDGVKYIATFVGYFPVENPMYSCIVIIHKPNKSIGYYGSAVSAPVFKKIAHKIYAQTPSEQELILANNLPAIDKKFDEYYKQYNRKQNLVPNVVNMAGMDAIPLLENLGFKVLATGTGKVKEQSVKPGGLIEKGRIIQLKLS